LDKTVIKQQHSSSVTQFNGWRWWKISWTSSLWKHEPIFIQ